GGVTRRRRRCCSRCSASSIPRRSTRCGRRCRRSSTPTPPASRSATTSASTRAARTCRATSPAPTCTSGTSGWTGNKRRAMRDLVVRLNELCDALPFQSSWYVKDMRSGQRADRFGGGPVPSASTRKISIMMAALAAVHAGKLSLDQKVTIDKKYQDNDSGTFQHLTPGFWITFRDALVMMIIVSDNTCTGKVVDMVGLGEIQRWCDTLGMTG